MAGKINPMRDSLIKLVQRDTSNYRFEKYLLTNNILRLQRYLENLDSVINGFIRIKVKYNFTNMNKWSKYSQYYPHLTLFKSLTETTLDLCIDYEGGVGPRDTELSPFIEDPMIYSEPDFMEEEDECYFVDADEKIHKKLFFTVLSHAWVISKGQECGLVVKTLENNSAHCFYLNDLRWNETSKFQNFKDRTQPIRNLYSDSISIEDIYKLAG